MTNDNYFLWALPVLGSVVVALQLGYGRVVISPWRVVEKAEDEGRFWLFIVAESLLVLILVGQALSAKG
jgi:hypothetical protein